VESQVWQSGRRGTLKLTLGSITSRREERKQAFDPFIPVGAVEACGKSAHAGYLDHEGADRAPLRVSLQDSRSRGQSSNAFAPIVSEGMSRDVQNSQAKQSSQLLHAVRQWQQPFYRCREEEES
jgi:hypothetical protein